MSRFPQKKAPMRPGFACLSWACCPVSTVLFCIRTIFEMCCIVSQGFKQMYISCNYDLSIHTLVQRQNTIKHHRRILREWNCLALRLAMSGCRKLMWPRASRVSQWDFWPTAARSLTAKPSTISGSSHTKDPCTKRDRREIDSSSIFGLYLTNLWLNSILLVLCERKEKALVQEFLQVTKGSITYRQCEANLYLIRFYFKFKHVFYSSARVAATMFDSILVIGLHQQSSMVSNKIIRFIHRITSPTTKHYSILLFHAILPPLFVTALIIIISIHFTIIVFISLLSSFSWCFHVHNLQHPKRYHTTTGDATSTKGSFEQDVSHAKQKRLHHTVKGGATRARCFWN